MNKTVLSKEKNKSNFHLKLLGLSLVIALFPSTRLGNVGFVDPNFYLGYSQAFDWLTSQQESQYHATRLPFISLLKIITFVEPEFVGLLYKIVLNLIFIYSWEKISKNCGIRSEKIIFWGGAALALSPIMISATAWTVAQSFALVISFAFWAFATDKGANRTYPIYLSSLLVILLNTNAFACAINILGYCTFLIFSKKHINLKAAIFLIILILNLALYEFVWQKMLGQNKSLWKEHFLILRSGATDNKGYGEWRSVFWQIENNQIPWLFLTLLLTLAVGVYFTLTSKNRENRDGLVQSVVAMTSASMLLSLFGFNPQFTSYWYFYFNLLPMSLLLIYSFKNLENRKSSEINDYLVLFTVATLFLAIHGNQRLRPSLAILFILGVFFYYIIVRNQIYKTKVFFEIICLGCAFLLLFFDKSLASSYVSSDQRNIQFLKDEYKLIEIVKKLPLERHSVAAWSSPDQSGFAGGLVSLIGYHLIRLEGLGNQTITPELSAWKMRNDSYPEYVVSIVNKEYDYSDMKLIKCNYALLETSLLPSKLVHIYIYKLNKKEACES
jgi:hypothetical protein